jgi:predicted nucleic acid-binding Zn ribbon protein
VKPAPDRRCAVCGRTIAEGADRRRRYCSGRCRQVAFRQRARSPRLRIVDVAELDELDEDEDEKLQSALVGAVLRASQTDWRAAKWLLETRWPERFGPMQP